MVKETKPVVVQTVVTDTKEEAPKVEVPQKDTIAPVADTTTVVADTTVAVTTDTIVPDTRRVVELALMLPFESQQTKRSSNAERMMEFYQGALLALHDLRDDSTLYRLRVYDIERSERRVNALCDSTELDSVRGVIGLVYPMQIERMTAWCGAKKVPLLLPFSDDIDLSTSPYVMQFNSSDRQEADSLCQWLKARDAHCVAIEVREADISSFIRTLRKQMRAQNIPYTVLALRDLMNDSATYALDIDKENIILLHSDRYQQIRMLLPHLQKLREAGYQIRLVSQYSWQKEDLTLPQVYTSMFTAESDRTQYDTLWNEWYTGGHVSETPRYDLLGYDLMQAMIAWLRGERELTGLQSPIRWIQVDEGGWQNSAVKVMEK